MFVYVQICFLGKNGKNLSFLKFIFQFFQVTMNQNPVQNNMDNDVELLDDVQAPLPQSQKV